MGIGFSGTRAPQNQSYPEARAPARSGTTKGDFIGVTRSWTREKKQAGILWIPACATIGAS
jgi:hypothetical protein